MIQDSWETELSSYTKEGMTQRILQWNVKLFINYISVAHRFYLCLCQEIYLGNTFLLIMNSKLSSLDSVQNRTDLISTVWHCIFEILIMQDIHLDIFSIYEKKKLYYLDNWTENLPYIHLYKIQGYWLEI